MHSAEAILARVKEEHVRFIELWFADIMGVVKAITISEQDLPSVLVNGAHFDGSSVEGFARVAESDMILQPDLATFVILPWSMPHRTARLICNVHNLKGDPFIGDPRYALLRVMRQAAEQDLRYKTGIELEFFLFQAQGDHALLPLQPVEAGGYFDLAGQRARGVLNEMAEMLHQLGISVDTTHNENGAGQFEIDLSYDDALTSADKVMTARIVMKAVAQQRGLHCTFMPRPDASLPGSGMHTHQSLHTLDGEQNVFYDGGDKYGLSATARYFLAGQLAHARGMCAILAPLVNSYKRLGKSFEAPVNVTWAHINRAALIRVPYISAGREMHTRLELRCPDPSSNPYLACAVMLAAGLDGIQSKMPLPDPHEEMLIGKPQRPWQLEMLPLSLAEALDALQQDDVVLGALGPFISDRYLAAKRQEYDTYSRQVTSWEVESYLNRY